MDDSDASIPESDSLIYGAGVLPSMASSGKLQLAGPPRVELDERDEFN